MLVPAPRPTLGPGRATVSRRALLAAAPLIALGGRARPALADTPLAYAVPSSIDLTQHFQEARAGEVSLEDLAKRFDNTPDGQFRLARWGYLDGFERVFESTDATGDEANLVSLLYLRFENPSLDKLTDAAYLLANDRARATRLRFAPPDDMLSAFDGGVLIKLTGPSDSGMETTYYAVVVPSDIFGPVLVRLLTVAAGDPTADANRLVTMLLLSGGE